MIRFNFGAISAPAFRQRWEGAMSETLDQLLTAQEVADKLRTTPSNLYRKIKAGRFPAPIQLSVRCVRWRESDVARWLNSLPTSVPSEADLETA
ncbi:helix-turn-helix transcriptional regulator [Gluconobacter oxydans]